METCESFYWRDVTTCFTTTYSAKDFLLFFERSAGADKPVVPPAHAGRGESYEVVLSRGQAIRVGRDFDSDVLKRLIATVAGTYRPPTNVLPPNEECCYQAGQEDDISSCSHRKHLADFQTIPAQ